MDKNTITGFVLIFIILMGWNYMMQPTEAQIEAEQRRVDSLEQVEKLRIDSLEKVAQNPQSTSTTNQTNQNTPISDSLQQLMLQTQFGAFQPAGSGTAEEVVLENENVKLYFSSKGAFLTKAEIKNYYTVNTDKETHEQTKHLLETLTDKKDKFEYLIPVNGKGIISSKDLFFDVEQNGNTVSFKAKTSNGGSFEQKYTLKEGSYLLDYDVRLNNLNGVLDPTADKIQLKWVNYLDKLEENTQYESMYSSIYFRESGESTDYCGCTTSSEEDLSGQKIDWFAHSNQFFQTAIMAKEGNKFSGGKFETENLEIDNEDLKILKTQVDIPFAGNTAFAMNLFIGPKKYETLAQYNIDLEDTIAFGNGIFGSVNRWLVRPIFMFLSKFIGSVGIVILLLTLIVKLGVYPLTYKMIHSQSKMAALKPQLANLKEKFKDDQQKMSMEQMKMYREFGVNPMGGCFPMLIQMPIWFALYRFFPASIEFRQESFLWATDLSTYDVFAYLPFEIPFYGAHVSLFTLLWAAATVAYSWYNMRHLDMSSMNNPAMKYMQYAMPVMFLFFFNSFAAGLTCYLFFSSLFNIGQTLVTKNYLINHDKIKEELEAYRKKPKKKGGFQSRLEAALKEQQRVAAEREKTKKKPRKKK